MKKLSNKIHIIAFCVLVVLSTAVTGYFSTDIETSQTASKQRWVFFDLGDTIVDTSKSGDFHYYSGALDYLRALKDMKIHVAIISNIPESFGETYEQKITSLKEYLKAHWSDDVDFDWSIFDKIYIPMTNEELKPAPYIFNKALDETGRYPSLYISESVNEVEAAKQLGYAGFHFIPMDKSKGENGVLYISLDEIEDYIDRNSHL